MMPNNQNEHAEFATEYQEISRDVKKVVIANLFVIAVLIAARFANQKYGFLNHLQKFF